MNLPLVCIALRGRTGSQIASDAKEAENLGADVVEVRLDNLWTTEERLQESADSEGTDSSRSEKVEFLVKQLELGEVDFETEFGIISQCTELPMILTCRPQRQGGFYPGNEDQRLEVLRSAISIEPWDTASCRGVVEPSIPAFTFAPFAISSSTISLLH